MSYFGDSRSPVATYSELSYSSTGDGSTVDFVLPADPVSEGGVDVWVGNVSQSTDAYQIIGTTLRFVEAPATGADIYVKFRGIAQSVEVISADAVTDEHFKNDVTVDKLSSGTAGTLIKYENGIAVEVDVSELTDPKDRVNIIQNSFDIAINAGPVLFSTVDGISDSYETLDGVDATGANYWKEDFVLENSALFDGSTGDLTRTFGTATDQNMWTISFWEKRWKLSTSMGIFFTNTGVNNEGIYYTAGDVFSVYDVSNGGPTSVFRDIAVWNHWCVTFDGTNLITYLNGEEITNTTGRAFATFNTAIEHYIGNDNTDTAFLGSYLCEFCFIDGIVHAVSDFGTVTENRWRPKEIVPGDFTWGTNGFYLDFSNAANLGEDRSGNGNNWTVSGTITQVTDTPTDDAANVFGDLAVYNRLGRNNASNQPTYSNGNRTMTGTTTNPLQGALTTLACSPTGKFYFEISVGGSTGDNAYIGLCKSDYVINDSIVTNTGANHYAGTNGNIVVNGSTAETAGTGAWTAGNIIGIAYDASAQQCWFHENGTWTNGDPELGTGGYDTSAWDVGQTHFFCVVYSTGNVLTIVDPGSWTYQPIGFNPLSTAYFKSHIGNLSYYFNTVLYTGDGVAIGSGGQAITGVGFQPDFVWIKKRSGGTASAARMFDSLRNANARLVTNVTDAEAVTTEELSSFDSDGFTVGSEDGANGSTFPFVAWCARLPDNETNTSGTISADWKYNPDLGMAIGTYTGNGVAGATLGLPTINGTTPFMHIHKGRSIVTAWAVGHSAIGTNTLRLNETSAAAARSTYFNSTVPTSSVITLGTDNDTNANGETYVIIVFWQTDFCRPISYEGNGLADGSLWYGGGLFNWGLYKNADAVNGWNIKDIVRSPTNPADELLQANASAAELTGSSYDADLLSIGIKARTADTMTNGAGTFVGVAFVEPVKKFSQRFGSPVGSNFVLLSSTQTAGTEPTSGYLVSRHQSTVPAIFGTDLKVWMTRDGGQTVTTNFAVNNKFTLASHPFVAGDRVVLDSTGNHPTGSSPGTLYFVVNPATNDFELSLTEGGAAISLSSDGTGTLSVSQFTEGTITEEGLSYSDSTITIISATADLSALPSGTSMRYLIESLNIDQDILETAFQWG